MMKTIMKLAAISTAMFVAGAALAQTNPAPTNSVTLVQNVNFRLIFYEQKSVDQESGNATVVKKKFTTADLIQALGNATGNSFSRSARLIAVLPSGATNAIGTFEVQDKDTTVPVSSYIAMTSASPILLYNIKTSRSGRQSGQDYTLGRLMVTNDAPDAIDGLPIIATNENIAVTLDLRGLAVTKVSTVTYKKTPYVVQQLSGNLSGSGMDNGTEALITGKVTISGRRFTQTSP